MRTSTFLKIGLLYKCSALIFILIISLDSFSQQAWNHVPSPDTSLTRNMVRGISGTSSSDVWAVGSFEETLIEKNFIMHWDGGGWQILPVINPSSILNDLWDVEAISANDVWAAGQFNDPGTTRSELLHWNGTNWSQHVLPNITGGSGLFSLDAISSNDIWAVGFKAGSPTDLCYTIHYDGSSWTEVSVPPVGTYYNHFFGVDGLTSTDVWAVGNKADAYGDFFPLAMHWNGTAWMNVILPASINTVFGELESITMISSNDVWATGSTVTGSVIKIHWDGSNWTDFSSSSGGGGAIAARSANDVFILGNEISNWNGSNWTVIDGLTQHSYPSLVSKVVFPNGDIWSGGRTWTTDNVFHSFIYRTANAVPQFVHGNLQTLNINDSNPQNIDEMLKAEDADISQVVTYSLITPPSHGTVSGLPDTAITNNGFAISSGVTYVRTPGYFSSDQFVVKVSVGSLTSQITINVSPVSALPVLISSYSVIKTGSTATVKWSTVSEINAKEFVVERSHDGISFTTINRIAAKGSGNNYKLVDPLPIPGWNYYRLQLIDVDGKLTTFPVKSLNFETSELNPIVVYPNPIVDKVLNIQLNVTGEYVLSLFNEQGQRVMSKHFTGPASVIRMELPNNITTGMYIISVITGKTVWSKEIFIK